MKRRCVIHLLCAWSLLWLANPAREECIEVSLNGTWQIEDSASPDQIPQTFRHTVPVPGLAHLAEPAFRDVDQFDSRELISRARELPESVCVSLGDGAGIRRQARNYFWYQRTFKASAKKQVAILKINKAQFCTSVWLNGRKIGEHLGELRWRFEKGYILGRRTSPSTGELGPETVA